MLPDIRPAPDGGVRLGTAQPPTAVAMAATQSNAAQVRDVCISKLPWMYGWTAVMLWVSMCHEATGFEADRMACHPENWRCDSRSTRLFERFYWTDPAGWCDPGEASGGMARAIVKAMVELHSGTVAAETASRPGPAR